MMQIFQEHEYNANKGGKKGKSPNIVLNTMLKNYTTEHAPNKPKAGCTWVLFYR